MGVHQSRNNELTRRLDNGRISGIVGSLSGEDLFDRIPFNNHGSIGERGISKTVYHRGSSKNDDLGRPLLPIAH